MTTPPSTPSAPPPSKPKAEPKDAAVVTIQYEDLVEFGNHNNDDNADDGDNLRRLRLEALVGEAFGPDGLGILAVTGVPGFAEHRARLLPLARQIALLSEAELHECIKPETLYSVGWSHGRESYSASDGGKPDYSKGSFYCNPLTDDLVESLVDRDGHDHAEHWKEQGSRHPEFYAPNVYPSSQLGPQLRAAIGETGQSMAAVGRLVAAVCDSYCRRHRQGGGGGGGVDLGLEATLTRSLNAKGRLLHYFAPRPAEEKQRSDDPNDEKKKADADGDNNDNNTDEALWCGWHNDHGSLTALMPAMYLDEDGQEVVVERNEDQSSAAGLRVQARSGEVFRVKLPPGACGFQIGETSQIQSGGLLRATPHAVFPAKQRPNDDKAVVVTRESFALFLEPEFDDPLAIPPGRTLEDCCQDPAVPLPASVVPLQARWRPGPSGMSFGDFHRATVSAFTPPPPDDDDHEE